MNTLKLTSLLLLQCCFWACSDFLRESSQDEVRPSTISDLEQILLGDGYTDGYNFYYATEIFTDNAESNKIVQLQNYQNFQSAYDTQKWLYTWKENMFNEEGGGTDITLWQTPYEGILGCNLVLDYLDEMYGREPLRESLRGEALTLRAWYYLHLANFFGIAYNQGDPRINPGVPLKLDARVKKDYLPRNSVAEVYAQIEKDLLEGNRLLTAYDHDRNFYRMGHLAAKAILSRVYLYMEEWDKALAYADSVLQVKPALLALSTSNSSTGATFVYNTTTPDEIIWARENTNGYNMSSTFFPTSSKLMGMYDGGTYASMTSADLRVFRYYFWYAMIYEKAMVFVPIGTSKSSVGDYAKMQGIRTAELYLNRAEAYANKYLSEGNEAYRLAALENLNTLRKKRYNPNYNLKEVDITDGKELLEFCIEERQRELVGETNHRWCDIRRYGMTITHVLLNAEATNETTHTQDMSLYALPIPEEILRRNPALLQN